MQVLNDRILITEKPAPEVKVGSIILPKGQGNGTCAYADVIHASTGYYENGNYVSMEVKEGDEIIFVKGANHTIAMPDGNVYRSITQKEVVCITNSKSTAEVF